MAGPPWNRPLADWRHGMNCGSTRYRWTRLPGAALLALSLLAAPGAPTLQPAAAQEADVRVSISQVLTLTPAVAGAARSAVGNLPDQSASRRDLLNTVPAGGPVTYTVTVT